MNKYLLKLRVFLALLFGGLTSLAFTLDDGKDIKEQAPKPRVDLFGDPLPEGALARYGTTRLRHGGRITGVAFVKDARTLASASMDGTIRLWDSASGKEQIAFRIANDAPLGLAFSPDGRFLVAGQYQVFELWDAKTGKPVWSVETPYEGTQFVAFNPDGKRLASVQVNEAGSGPTARFICLWDQDGAPSRKKLEGHTKPIGDLAFSPDGKLLLSASDDGTVRLWDVETAREKLRLDDGLVCARAAGFSKDGRLVAAGGNLAIRLWELPATKPFRTIEDREIRFITSLAFSPDGQTLASDSGKPAPAIHMWEIATGKEVRTFKGFGGGGLRLAFSPNGALLASGGEDNTVRLWDLAKGEERTVAPGHAGPVRAGVVLRNGKRCCTASADGTVRLWESATGKEEAVLRTASARVTALALSPDERLVACGGLDTRIEIWDLAARTKVRTIGQHMRNIAIAALAFTPDGKVLVSFDGDMRYWDVETGAEKFKPLNLSAQAFSAAISHDGKILVAGTYKQLSSGAHGGCITFLNPSTGTYPSPEERGRWRHNYLEDESGYAEALIFSPDDRVLASAGRNWDVCLWDGKTREPFRRLCQESDVLAVAFSPDGKFLAVGCKDATIRIWDWANGEGKELRQLTGHRGAVTSLAFSADGTKLLSGSADTTALLWDVGKLEP